MAARSPTCSSSCLPRPLRQPLTRLVAVDPKSAPSFPITAPKPTFRTYAPTSEPSPASPIAALPGSTTRALEPRTSTFTEQDPGASRLSSISAGHFTESSGARTFSSYSGGVRFPSVGSSDQSRLPGSAIACNGDRTDSPGGPESS